MEGYRLSPQQERVFYMCAAARAEAFRSMCAAQVYADLDTRLLQSSLERVVARHEILRTSYRLLGAMSLPAQVISESAPVRLREIDLTQADERERRRAVGMICADNKRSEPQPEQGAGLRVSLVRLGQRRQLLVVSAGALCSDARGLKNVVRELIGGCEAGEAEEGERVQYADVSEIFNHLAEAEETKAGRQYWHKVLGGEGRGVRLAMEKQAPAREEFRPEVEEVEAPEEVSRRAREVSRGIGVEEAACMMSAMGALIGRVSGEKSLRVGVRCEGRTFEGLKEAVGLYERYIPIDLLPDDRVDFLELTESVGKSMRELYKWQNYFDWREFFAQNKKEGSESYFDYL